jgi:hypothetical protein
VLHHLKNKKREEESEMYMKETSIWSKCKVVASECKSNLYPLKYSSPGKLTNVDGQNRALPTNGIEIYIR